MVKRSVKRSTTVSHDRLGTKKAYKVLLCQRLMGRANTVIILSIRSLIIILLVAFSIAVVALAQPNVTPSEQTGIVTGFATSENTNVTARSLDIEISLKEDGSANWRVEMVYAAPVTSADYLVLADAKDLSIKVGDKSVDCSISEREVGTAFVCPNINGSIIVYSFMTPDIVNRIGSFQNFDYSFRIDEQIDLFALKISLPLGSILADPARLEGTGLSPFRPSFGREGSNGRQILVSWDVSKPRIGDVIDASVIYEQLSRTVMPPFVWVAIALAVAAVGFSGWVIYSRSRPERLLPALGERERPVMELIIKQRTLDQRDIVRATGWPKAKVSRAIRVLTDRGLVEALPKGRTKEVRLIEQHGVRTGLVKRILGFRVKQRAVEIGLNRNQAIELVQTTITPLADWLDGITRRLHAHKFDYGWNENAQDFAFGESWEIPISREQKDRNMKDVGSLAPNIETRFSSTETLLNEIETRLEQLSRSISGNKKFAAACGSPKSRGFEGRIENLVRHIIDRDKIISDVYAWSRFWNSHSRNLLRTAETGAVKTARMKLDQSATKLNKSAKALKEELEHVREQLRRQYHIMYKEYRA